MTRLAGKSLTGAVPAAYGKYRFWRCCCIWAYADFLLVVRGAPNLSRVILGDTVDFAEHKASVAFHTIGRLSLTIHLNLLFHASELCSLYLRPFADTFMCRISYLPCNYQHTKYYVDTFFFIRWTLRDKQHNFFYLQSFSFFLAWCRTSYP